MEKGGYILSAGVLKAVFMEKIIQLDGDDGEILTSKGEKNIYITGSLSKNCE